MLALALAVALSVQQDTTLDIATYTSREWGVSMPRPFDDWIFAPATARGTTTVIFQPRSGALSEQLWGALVMSSWGRPVPLGEVADRRITTTWRSTLGPTFQLLARDSLEIAGLPAIHLVMSGAINLAVLDVEEYLLARDSELVALQFRYPRGLPRDSIGAGYQRALAGLRVRTPVRAAARRPATSPPWDVGIEGDLLFFDLPEAYRAIAPGRLSSEVVAQGRRLMRWSPFYGMPDTSLYSVGHYQLESRTVGRLTLRLWRNQSTDTALTHITDDMIAQVAQAWGTYWRDFGPVPTTEVTMVETPWHETHGGPAALFVGADLKTSNASFIIRRELARSWWGGVVRATGPAAWLISEVLPSWSAALTPGAIADSSAVAGLEATRRIAGDARFREAIRTFLAESRNGPPAVGPFMTLLGDSAASSIRALMRGQAR